MRGGAGCDSARFGTLEPLWVLVLGIPMASFEDSDGGLSLLDLNFLNLKPVNDFVMI